MTRPLCPFCKKAMAKMASQGGTDFYSCRDRNCPGARKNFTK